MGIDLLDVQFRIKTAFGLQLEQEFFPDLIAKHHPDWKKPGQPRPDVTVGQIYKELLERLRRENRLDGDYSQLRALTLHSVLDSLKRSFERPDLAAETLVKELLPPPLNRASWNRLAASLAIEPPLIPWTTMTQLSYGGGCLVVVVLWFTTFLFAVPIKSLVAHDPLAMGHGEAEIPSFDSHNPGSLGSRTASTPETTGLSLARGPGLGSAAGSHGGCPGSG